MKLICKQCGKEFNGRKERKFCSRKCRGEYRTKTKTFIQKCKWCGKEFRTSKLRPQKFCSKSCYAEWEKGKPAIPNLRGKRGKKPRNRKISTCVVCGRKFEHWVGRNAKYCSRECWNKRNPKVLKNCLFCGKEFWSYQHENKEYCSRKCYGLHKRELQKGENSHFWRGGKTKLNKLLRTRAKYTEWRKAVFERDNYTCQDCGIKNGEGVKVYLQAHHIKPVSKFPDLVYDVSNGITLCKNCHLLRHHHKF